MISTESNIRTWTVMVDDPITHVDTDSRLIDTMSGAQPSKFETRSHRSPSAADSSNGAKSWEREIERETRSATVETDTRRNGQFMSFLSREFRKPLSSLLGHVDLVADPKCPDHERSESLDKIRKHGEALMELVQNLGDLGQLEAGTFRLENDTFSTSLALAHVLSQARARAQALGRDVVVRYTTPIPRMLNLDTNRFRQCLSTITHFVIENTSRGDVTMQTAVVGYDSERRLAFDVSANCNEPDSHDTDPIIRPITATASGTAPTRRRNVRVSADDRPWSLSMSVATRLARMMGGSLDCYVDTELLRLRLTIQPPAADFLDMAHLSLPSDQDAPLSSQRPSRLRGTILLVDDTPTDREAEAISLERIGLRVDSVSRGADAIDRADQRYDAILMDVEMPDIDGLETTRVLRSLGVTVPIIAMLSSDNPANRDSCYDAGCTAYLAKPLHGPSLLGTLDSLISTTEDRRIVSLLPPALASDDPLASSREHDPSVRQVLPQFITRITRFAAHVARSIRNNDYRTASKTAQSLGAAARTFGFPVLAEEANSLAKTCQQTNDIVDNKAINEHLESLQSIVRRIQAAYP